MKYLLLSLLVTACMCGCSSTPPIERYAESKSHFMNGPVVPKNNYSPQDVYRVYERGATGFVPVSALRSAAEERAEEFCKRQNRSMVVLAEKRTIAFPLPGNFPAIELVFAAVPRTTAVPTGAEMERLTKLKKLRDAGVITAEDFDREKEQFLNSR